MSPPSQASLAPADSSATRWLLVAAVAAPVLAAGLLWWHYGTALFMEAVVAMVLACF